MPYSYNQYPDCSYDSDVKREFHATTKSRLRKLAKELELTKGDYEIRSNMGGIAVSGEITLHHKDFYLQVDQSFMGPRKSIMFRTCSGLTDYTGGENNFADITLLNNIPALADLVKKIIPSLENSPKM